MFNNLFAKKQPPVATSYQPLPYWVTGPVPDIGMWKEALDASGPGPLQSDDYGVMKALLAGSPVFYDFK